MADGIDSGAGAGSDVGQTSGNETFTLPDSFDEAIDEGIEVQESETPEGAGDTGGSPPAGAPAPTGQPAAPGQQPGQQPAAAAAAAPQPGQQPGQQPQQQAGQVPSGGEAGAAGRIYSPGELAQMLGQNRDKLIDGLAAQKFQLTPAETQALEVDAVGTIPKLLARVYYEATVNGLQQMANMVPRMVEQIANTRIVESESESEFHAAWPNIDKNNAQHMNVVAQLANSFRTMNPSATKADAIRYVGMAATSFLGLQMPQARSNGGGQRPAPAARRGAPPFAPAAGGRAQPPAGTPTAPANPFGGMGMDFDE